MLLIEILFFIFHACRGENQKQTGDILDILRNQIIDLDRDRLLESSFKYSGSLFKGRKNNACHPCNCEQHSLMGT